jgi:hypothetical protein
LHITEEQEVIERRRVGTRRKLLPAAFIFISRSSSVGPKMAKKARTLMRTSSNITNRRSIAIELPPVPSTPHAKTHPS